MDRRGAADEIESAEPEAWLQGAISRVFGDRWEARPMGVPRSVEDAWRLGNLHAPAIDLDTGCLVEVQFPITSWGDPIDGEVLVRKLCRGTPVQCVPCRTREATTRGGRSPRCSSGPSATGGFAPAWSSRDGP